MKKALLTMTIVMFISFAAAAQDINIGAKAGLNLATLKPDLNDPAVRTSFHLGGVVEIPLLDELSLQPELFYSSQGVKDESDDDEEVRLNYLSIPVLAKYYVAEGLSIEAGPQIGFLLSAEVEDNGDTTDLKDTTKSTDFGFALGLGYKLENGLNFAARYYFGSDVNDIESDTDKFKNNVFQLSIGYFFN
ncbi:porin family protein [Muriicola sp. Z0-33]|uniref:porin family protein n=1 Tax=Muriicola sp. Z0-33 TaxID=2816957 RepID=UPI002238519A|nr:porin family protein [Muriicola sp. Z0-33]MCW5516339.1 PorT family protein [Muriicola sp. Z0-33]